MAFWKKDERIEKELEGIKNRVEGKPPLPTPPPLEEEAEDIVPEEPEKAPEAPTPTPKISAPKKGPEEPSAPLSP